jgi:hypothetical protein
MGTSLYCGLLALCQHEAEESRFVLPKEGKMSEKCLMEELIQLTGIPNELMRRELESMRNKAGLENKPLTIEDLRGLIAEYLQETLVEAKKKYTG